MLRSRSVRLYPTGGLTLVVVLGVACRGATEIVVDVRTSVSCTDPKTWKGVAIYAGAPGLDVETKQPSLTSATCGADGHVGSIALTPSGAKDGAVGIRIVAGLTRPPEECADHGYEGCIVARRTLSFIPHESLALDVALAADCIGQACDSLHSCISGSCQDARLSVTPSADAGAGSTGPTVRCGGDGTRCPVSGPEVCCVTPQNGGTTGVCSAPESCPPASAILRCDDDSQCTGPVDDAGAPFVCCLSYGSPDLAGPFSPNIIHLSQCLSYSACINRSDYGLSLCEKRGTCAGTPTLCTSANDALPGYFWCPLNPH